MNPSADKWPASAAGAEAGLPRHGRRFATLTLALFAALAPVADGSASEAATPPQPPVVVSAQSLAPARMPAKAAGIRRRGPAVVPAAAEPAVRLSAALPPLITCADVWTAPLPGECDAPAKFRVTIHQNTLVPVAFFLDYGQPTQREVADGARFPGGATRVTAVATGPTGLQSTCDFFVHVTGNLYWTEARRLNLEDPDGDGVFEASTTDCLTQPDQSRWYKFPVKPGGRVAVTLTDLPVNCDLVLFRDIAQTYQEITSPTLPDLQRLGAEFAADALSPAALSPAALSPAALSPAAFSPAALSAEQFSSLVFAPAALSPAALSEVSFSPDAYAPAALSPAALSPAALSPDEYSPAALSPAALSPAALSSAQIRSVLGISAFDGLTPEGLLADTWMLTGNWYVRVRGRNGDYLPGAPFRLRVFYLPGRCEDVSATPSLPPDAVPLSAEAGAYRTLVLTDFSRLPDPADHAALQAKLAAFAARPEVAGKVLDVASDPAAAWFRTQAERDYECPYAMNLLADAIREIIRRSHAANPGLENIVLLGSDRVIPFFRYPDQALLGPERDYVPPVRPVSTSQASLRLNFVLGQDAYGAACDLAIKVSELPMPRVPVGRLVETPQEIMTMLDAYLATPDGVVATPATALVTGYDFLEDAAQAVKAELEAGIQGTADALIVPGNLPPDDPQAWTAADLRPLFLERRQDLIFLAGHFSASLLLASDFATTLAAGELAASATDLRNALLFSAGCHSGYNIVDEHGVPALTREPDWAQACARKGMTLVAGTGYQYGDTDFIEYSERLYLQFAKELRAGSGPVSVGQALVRAKRWYLANTPALRGIHEKSFLQATLFGLPNLRFDLPGRTPVTGDNPDVGPLTAASVDPGLTLGLTHADLSLDPAFTEHTVTLTIPDDDPQTPDATVEALYLSGGAGVVNNPTEPILPLEVRNVTVDGRVLRGVGFRRGRYTDRADVLPLTGAATTEFRGVHAPFAARAMFPPQWWSVNYFDGLCDTAPGPTRLMLTTAQFISADVDAWRGTLRQYDHCEFRLFYSDNVTAYPNAQAGVSVIPAMAAPAAISDVRAEVTDRDVAFRARVVADPAAGVQEVWLNFTATRGAWHGAWEMLALARDPQDSTLWRGTLTLPDDGTQPGDVRYFAQAVTGPGLVSVALNAGVYYRLLDAVPGELTATQLEFVDPPTSGVYGSESTFRVRLRAGDQPAADRLVTLRLGDQSVRARTDADGRAALVLDLRGTPGNFTAKAVFGGDDILMPAFAETAFALLPQPTRLRLEPEVGYVRPGAESNVRALLTAADGDPLPERTVLFLIQAEDGTWEARAQITDQLGRARLGPAPLAAGQYLVTASFGGTFTMPNAEQVELGDGRYDASTDTLGGLIVDDASPSLRLPDADLVLSGTGGTPVTASFKVQVSDPSPVTLTVATQGRVLLQAAGEGTVIFQGATTGGAKEFDITGTFAAGVTELLVTAADAAGNRSEGVFVVRVDAAPPSFTLTATPDVLQPADGRMVRVVIRAVATDDSGLPVQCSIVKITSNEPYIPDSVEPKDRFEGRDYKFHLGAMKCWLRAKRDPLGNGRVYTITVECRDAFGNVAQRNVLVTVPR